MTMSDQQPSANPTGGNAKKPSLLPEQESSTAEPATQQKNATTTFITTPPQRHQRRKGPLLLLTLLLLVVVVILGSFVGQRLLSGATILPSSSIDAQNLHLGPFAQQPFNSRQIDSLRNLVTRMKYKQLASLYVSRMSLDEELGQLIMVEYGDTTYSDDLNTMVNTLHAGGVIMYEFQMMTAAQTRHDIDLMQKNATFPLLISTDEEGGIVHRLINIYPPRPSALSIYNSGSLNYAAQQGHLVAHDLKA
ncbi:MAG: hypothetical protein JO011_20350, partial [Ktedonobacteraceae bacterium]|nr:hypothetical protein [Ktedonobacteraceae bacterium]